jgi:hypothetical protein
LQPNDRARIIRLLWDMVCIDPAFISVGQRARLTRNIVDLLRKKKALRTATPSLVLPWRPIVEILRTTHGRNPTDATYVGVRELQTHGSECVRNGVVVSTHPCCSLLTSSYCRRLGLLLRKARSFFPPESSMEIWDEFVHRLSLDAMRGSAVNILSASLPTHSGTDHSAWADQAFTLWFSNSPMREWDAAFFDIFNRLAKNQCGVMNFDAYLPTIFTRAMVLFRLPTNAGTGAGGGNNITPGRLSGVLRPSRDLYYQFGVIIAYCLGPQHPKLLELLPQFMKVCHNYLHPSNNGSWGPCIAQMMLSLCENVAERLNLERTGEATTPESCWLTEGYLSELVQCLREPLFLGLFSKSPMIAWAARAATKVLAALEPQTILPPIVERMMPYMEVGTPHPQTLCACMSVIADCMPTLLDSERFPEGLALIPTLLMGTVEGLDQGDKLRTRTTLKLYCSVLSCAYLQPLSAEAAYTADESIAAISACLEEWSAEFIKRALKLVNHSVKPDKSDVGDHTLLRQALQLFFSNISPAMYAVVLKTVAEFTQCNLFHNALQPVGHVVEEAAAGLPAVALELLVPLACTKLGKDAGSSEEEQRCMLRVLSKAIKKAGAEILKYKDLISEIMARFGSDPEKKEVYKEAGMLLRCAVHGLATIYPMETCTLLAGKNIEISSWGQYSTAETVTVEWHVPSEDELSFAKSLVQATGAQALEVLGQTCSGTAEFLSKDARCCALQMLRSVLRTPLAWRLGREDETGENPVRAENGQSPLVLRSLPAGQNALAMTELHAAIGACLHTFAQHAMAELSNELDTLRALCKCINYWIGGHGDKGYNKKVHMLQHTKAMMANILDNSEKCRAWVIKRVEVQQLYRVYGHRPTMLFTPACEAILDDLLALGVHPYSTVRKLAQEAVDAALHEFPYRKAGIIRTMTAVLQRGAEALEKEEANGAIYFLTSHLIMPRLARDFKLLKAFVLGVCEQLGQKKPSLQLRVDRMFMSMLAQVCFPSIAAPAAADYSMGPDGEKSVSQALIDLAVAANTRNAESRRADYVDFVASMGKLVAKDSHWKQSLIAQTCMTFCANVTGIAPKAEIAVSMCQALSSNDYLARRLGVMTATVAVGLNQDMLEIQSVAVDEAVDHRAAYAQPPPKSAEEWASTTFLDDFDCGFNGPMPAGKLTRKSAGVGGGVDLELDGQGLSLLQDTDELQKVVDFMVTDHQSEDGNQAPGRAGAAEAFIGALYRKLPAVKAGFCITHAYMWDKFFRLGGLPLFKRVQPMLAALMRDEAGAVVGKRDKQAVAAEIVGGAVRGAKYWPYADVAALWEAELLPVMETVARHAAGEVLSDWRQAVMFATNRRDPRRVWWLTEWLTAHELRADTDTKQCVAVLGLTSALLESLGWRCGGLCAEQLRKLESVLAHPFKQVRVEVSAVVAMAIALGPAEAAAEVLPKLQALCTAPALADAPGFVDVEVDGVDEESAIRTLSNARETMLWTVARIIQKGPKGNPHAQGAALQLLPQVRVRPRAWRVAPPAARVVTPHAPPPVRGRSSRRMRTSTQNSARRPSAAPPPSPTSSSTPPPPPPCSSRWRPTAPRRRCGPAGDVLRSLRVLHSASRPAFCAKFVLYGHTAD